VTHPLTDRLRSRPPELHGAGEYWGLAWSALEWIEENVEPGMATLETGAGASTIVFAARGALHEAVTPEPSEEQRVRGICERLEIDSSGVTFRIGLSHDVLPNWESRELDLVLIDGAHGFPYPILDWWHLAPHVRIGGRVLLDDAYLPAVTAIVDFARASPAWELEPAVSFRTALVRKVSDEPAPFDADAAASHGRMSFRYLPPARRVAASARQRLFSTRAGLWLVRKARPPSD
jgi:Methyltransferase domain